MNCTAIRIIKMIKPITKPSVPSVPTTKEANALTILPSKSTPLDRISLVELTFNARPKTVVIRSKVGKTEKSSGFVV